MKLISTFLFVIILASLALTQVNKLSPELASLAAAERAFAKYSVDNGQHEAFLQFFAEDGVACLFALHKTEKTS